MALKKTAPTNAGKEFEKALNEVEQDNIRHLSDYVTNEEGEVEDVPLLAGIEYEGEHLSTFSFREMTGRDEEAISKPEVRSNGGKLINVLLERTVTKLGSRTKKELGTAKWGELIRSLLSGDLDYMMLKVRQLSKGNDITFTHKCPHCNSELKTIIGCDEFKIIPFNGMYEVEFELPGRGYKDTKGVYHKTGTIRAMNGFDREIVVPLFKKNPSTAITMALTRLIKFDDDTPVFSNGVADMSLRDREYLEELMKDTVFGIDTKVELTCDVCGEDLSGTIGTSNII